MVSPVILKIKNAQKLDKEISLALEKMIAGDTKSRITAVKDTIEKLRGYINVIYDESNDPDYIEINKILQSELDAEFNDIPNRLERLKGIVANLDKKAE